MQLVSDYNTRKHRMIDIRSVDVTPAIIEKLLAMVYNKRSRIQRNLK